MLKGFFERSRFFLLILLSAMILAAAGFSLGFGLTKTSESAPRFESAGLEGAPGAAAVSAPVAPSRIDLNRATVAELTSLPGIGAVKARAIVDYRASNGPFQDPSEVQNVSGIGPKTYARIVDLITVE